jgi:hypothetical protein
MDLIAPDEVSASPPQVADVVITLAVAPHRNVWAGRTHYAVSGSTMRNAGVLPIGFNAHSGLSISLTAAMRSISQARLGKTKLTNATICIETLDRLFAHAIDQIVTHQRVTTLKSARSLFVPLVRSLAFGKIVTREIAFGDKHLQSLKGWSVASLTPKIENRVSLRVFTPKHIEETRKVLS